jgi:gliding-associated putative ABC transporter substrate-binding component GldG
MRRIQVINFLVVIAILVVLNALSSIVFYQVDLTEDQRYTLAKPTQELLKAIDDPIDVEVLLEGDFPAGFKRLQNGVKETFRQFGTYTPYLDVRYVDPNEGNLEEVNARREQLGEQGIYPTNLRVNDGTEMKEKMIYPHIIFNFAGRQVVVNILENNPGFDQEQNLNNSINLLEYKFANALQKLRQPVRKSILFTTGRGELEEAQTLALESQLRQFHLTDRMPIDSTIAIDPETDLLIVAKPTKPFTDRDKFILDQYLMQGGRILWLIDRLGVNLDSMSGRGDFVPPPLDLNLDDLFFKYGVRINSDMVLDLECTRIPQVIGRQGGKPQIELIPWYYHTLAVPSSDHPISKNLDRVNLFFPSSIDTVQTKTPIKKTILLRSSEYSRKQLTPTRLNFEILRYPPDPKKFNQPSIPQAVLLEGAFPSLFENRVTVEMKATFAQLGLEFRKQGVSSKMVVVADGDLGKNLTTSNGSPQPLGYNKWESLAFPGNSDFILNSVEYLLDDTGLLEARSKDLKLRLLDKVRCQEERAYWQWFNIALPLLLLALFGGGFHFVRKKRYQA